MLDIFGNPLQIGDFVLYSELMDDGKTELCMYEIVEERSGQFVGEIKSGSWIGCRYTLVDTVKRCVILRNVYKDANFHALANIN